MEIGEPIVLAKLPRAGLTGEGNTQFSQVFGIRDGLRKKRHEICAAVDGNSVNVYEIVNGRNIASWPIPLDSTFLCPPLSERISQNGTDYVRRTWCAVKRRDQTSITRYESVTKNGDTTSQTKNLVIDGPSPVVKLDYVETAERCVVCVKEDGSFDIVASDAGAILRSGRLSDGTSSLKILAVECLDLASAQTSWLRSRQDVVATIAPTSLVITCAYEKSQSRGLFVGVWSLTANQNSQQSDTTLLPVISHDLGHHSKSSSLKTSHVELCTGAKLEITGSTSTTIFDLSTIRPQKLPERKHPSSDSISNIELTHGIHIYLSPTKLQLFNRNFGSVLAARNLDTSLLKRKRDQENIRRLSLIVYFSQMRRVLAYNDSQILAIDISTGTELNTFKQGSLLIGNILRGTDKGEDYQRHSDDSLISIGSFHTDKPIPNWLLVSQELDVLVQKNDAKSFENIFKKTFNLQKAKDMNISRVPESKMKYLLSNVFAVVDSDSNPTQKQLKITFLPHQLLKWCISGGYLDNHIVSAAIGTDMCIRQTDAIVLALADADATLDLVEHYLQYSPYLDPDVLKLSIQLLIGRASGQIEPTSTQLTMAPVSATSAEKSFGVTTRSSAIICLLRAIKRFAYTGTSVVSKCLRDFDHSTILPLIQVLRQQMFLGGFGRLGATRALPSPPLSEADESSNDGPPQLDLASIVTVLNGCVDAIGPLGIFGTDDVYGAMLQKVVPELLSEIAAACQGVEDSTALQGLVRETLRYAESVEKQPLGIRQKTESKAMKSKVVKGRVVTLYAEPMPGDAGNGTGIVLPMSLKAADVNPIKISRNGRSRQRSAREMGSLKDRLKAPYSFERLVL